MKWPKGWSLFWIGEFHKEGKFAKKLAKTAAKLMK